MSAQSDNVRVVTQSLYSMVEVLREVAITEAGECSIHPLPAVYASLIKLAAELECGAMLIKAGQYWTFSHDSDIPF